MQRVVDFSQGADLTQSTIDWWKANNVGLAVPQYSAKLPSYLTSLDNQGLEVDVYVYLYFPKSPWDQTPEERVRTALGMCQGHQVKCIWNDVEDPADAQGPTNWQSNINAMWECILSEQANGYEAGIYTSIYRYQERFGDYTGFSAAGVKLWNADYLAEFSSADLSKEPTGLLLRHGNYGGWTKPDMWQWHNTAMFGGHSVDLSIREDPVNENDQIELSLLRAGRTFIQWYIEKGLARFADYGGQTVELLKVTGPGQAESFDPPIIIPLE